MTTAAATVGPASVPPLLRVRGLGTLYGKTVRDSRRAFLVVVVFLALVLLTGAAAIATAFGTEQTRQEMIHLAQTLPSVFQGMLGRPVGLDTLGGLIEWRYAVILSLLVPIWSILALSSTLAGEASRGSLELVLTGRFTRIRVAIEKLAAHVTVVALAMVLTTLMIWLCGVVFATLPGDEISLRAAAGYGILAFLLVLTPGSIAFAAAPFIGRGAAAGLAGVAMVAAYFINGFRSSIDAFETLTPLSWFAWTTEHIPLAGREDWGAVLFLGGFVVALWIVGIVAFDTRDIGRTVRIPWPHLPSFVLGLRGPMGRTFGERIGTASAWGLGIGFYVLIVSSTSEQLIAAIRDIPTLQQMMAFIYPDIDYTTVGGILQLIFVEFGLIVFGIAAATLVGGWASEEGSTRLDLLLAAPMTRASWLVRSGLGTYLSILFAAAIVALAAGVGAAAQGSDVVTPTIGSFVLALYALAWAGVGLAVGGVVRSSLASPIVIALTVGTFLISLFATALDLPAWVAGLALPVHYGKPLVGDWDPVGVVVSLALAVAGLVVGAWGLQRRDTRG